MPNMFQPTGGEDDMPQQGPAVMSNLMTGPGQQTMQPPQTPEEHAQAKQGWLDWFKNPSTSAFLMQFGASMLQPNVRGFGAQLGQSIGEGGAAVQRMQEQEQKQQETEAQSEELAGRGQYYKAVGEAQPLEAKARLQEAQARMQEAMVNASKLPLDEQRIALQQALGEQRLALQGAGVDLATQRLAMQQAQLDADKQLKAAQTALDQARTISPAKQQALDSWYRAVNAYQSDITGQLKMPDLKNYPILSPEDVGMTTAPTTPSASTTGQATVTAPTTGPAQTVARPYATAPAFRDSPGLRGYLSTATPEQLQQLRAENQARGNQMDPALLDKIIQEVQKTKSHGIR